MALICIGLVFVGAALRPTEKTLPPEPGATRIPADPSATYFVIETSGPPNNRVIVTRRVARDGAANYSRREYDCGSGTWRYLGTGGSIAAMNASKPDAAKTPILPESIASYIGGIACK